MHFLSFISFLTVVGIEMVKSLNNTNNKWLTFFHENLKRETKLGYKFVWNDNLLITIASSKESTRKKRKTNDHFTLYKDIVGCDRFNRFELQAPSQCLVVMVHYKGGPLKVCFAPLGSGPWQRNLCDVPSYDL